MPIGEARMPGTGVALTKPQTPAPQPLKGTTRTIGIADVVLVRSPERVRTILGSCVGVAICDRTVKLGGLAHVILPASNEGSGDPGKFADTAVDLLLEQLVSEGAEKLRLAAKIAGGAAMFGDDHPDSLGRRNVEAVLQRLAKHAIRMAGSAVGGRKGRRMVLDPATGDVQVEVIGESPQVL